MSRGSCGNSPSEEEAGMLRPGSLSRLEGRALRWGAEGGGTGKGPGVGNNWVSHTNREKASGNRFYLRFSISAA